jgi:uncharacterized phage protein (TIGR02220 family)
MATQRYISTSFWDDEWVSGLGPEEKLAYLYLLTNPLTNIAGVYKISIKRMAYDMDLDRVSIVNTLDKFKNDEKAYYHGEFIVIPSWPKHQKVNGHPKIKAGIYAILDSLSSDLISFLKDVNYAFDLSKYDSLSETIDSDGYRPNYSDPDPDRDLSILSGKPDGVKFLWEPLDYLREKTGKDYRRTSTTLSRLKARYREGYTVEDFKRVIDSKASEWEGKEGFDKFLRPETIFGPKFDTYLAQVSNGHVEVDRDTGVPEGYEDVLAAVRAANQYD